MLRDSQVKPQDFAPKKNSMFQCLINLRLKFSRWGEWDENRPRGNASLGRRMPTTWPMTHTLHYGYELP